MSYNVLFKIPISENEPVPIIVVGNKNDLDPEREVMEANARSLVESLDAMYIETSAKETDNARQVFNSLLETAFSSTTDHQGNVTSRKQRLSKKLLRRSSSPLTRRSSDGINNNRITDPKCTIL